MRRTSDGFEWFSFRAALSALAVAVSGQLIYALTLTNLGVLLLPMEAAIYLLARRGRWLGVGITLGLSFVLKPMLFPVLVILAVKRKWTALAMSIALPLVLSAVALAMAAQPAEFLRQAWRVLVHNANGSDTDNVNLSGIGDLLNVAVPIVVAARVLVIAAAIVVAAKIWRSTADEADRVVWVSTVLLAGLLLTCLFAHTFYGLLLAPIALYAAPHLERRSSQIAIVGSALTLAPVAHLAPGVISDTSRVAVCAGMLLIVLSTAVRAREFGGQPNGVGQAEDDPAEAGEHAGGRGGPGRIEP